jgi:Na+/melibiose symporter-like transporter
VLVTLGLASFVYGFTRVAEASQKNAQVGSTASGWTDPWALIFIAVGAGLVVAFVLLELKTRNPLLPMRIVLDRNRGGAYLTSTLVGAGLIGAFFFLSLYFQDVLHYSPVKAGFASLPTTVGVLISAGAASALVPKVGPRPLMVLGGLLAAAGLFTMSFLGVDNGFWELAFPGQLLLGLGLGFTFVPLSNLALVGAGVHDAGVASAMLNATQQVGASIGTALLATLAVGATTAAVTADQSLLVRVGPGPADVAPGPVALVEGYTTAFTWASVLLVLGAIAAGVLIKATKEDLPAEAVVHAG